MKKEEYAIIYLGLGTNLAPRIHFLEQAKILIKERIGAIVKESSIAKTKPWGFLSENTFLNQIIVVHTSLTAMDCLSTTQSIEQMLGRSSKSSELGYTDRCIDIDILYWNNETIDLPTLTVPHPKIKEREFILVHLRELGCEYI